MQKYHKHFNTKQTPQTKPIPNAKTPQVKMRSGGYGWQVGDWERLDRFLILGTEGGTYYVREQTLTVEASQAVQRCIAKDGARVVKTTVDVSQAGRAPKNDPALFVLAMCCKLGDSETKTAAYRALPKVARIGTHLFHFAEYCKAFGGLGGNGFKRAIGRWYNDKPAGRLCYQAVKYQSRDGWSHRDLLRLAHIKPASEDHNALYHWMVHGWNVEDESDRVRADMVGSEDPLRLMIGFELAKQAEKVGEVVNLIEEYGLPRECVPTQFLNEAAVWEALLPTMPITAMIRNLNKMTVAGLVTNTSRATQHICGVLADEARLVKARVHPIAVLLALKTYQQGRGFRGSLTWRPASRVVDALDAAFYLAFKTVEPTNKRLCLGLDISGSMSSPVSGQPFLTCYEAEAALAMVTARVESTYEILGFTSGGGSDFQQMSNRGWRGGAGVLPLTISPRQRLDDIVHYMRQLPMGGTDATMPIRWAETNKVEIDAFVVMTDNESWAGPEHVTQALDRYRQKTGIPAKLVAVAMTADKYSVANPDDPAQLNVVGLDTATPNVISQFITG